mmetsp:Transcript_32664/g.104053  ORF Transcript_32664/g.104053 Transcript_32664/m.104053 type:complete len:387 (+) Transcript_32664:299-1459(+)
MGDSFLVHRSFSSDGPGFETIQEREDKNQKDMEDEEQDEEEQRTNGEAIEDAIKVAVKSVLAKELGHPSVLEDAPEELDDEEPELFGPSPAAATPQKASSVSLAAVGHIAAHVAAPAPAAAATPPAAPAAAPEAQPPQPAPEQPAGLRIADAAKADNEARGPSATVAPPTLAPKAAAPPHALPVISVSFQPGTKRGSPLALLSTGRRSGSDSRSTIAQIKIIDQPGTGNDRTDVYGDALRHTIESGDLQEALARYVSKAVHMERDLVVGTVFQSSGKVTPYNTTSCSAHLKMIIHRFSTAYTRDKVPEALYHSCDNFGQKESFSHDTLINHIDRQKCREATKRFVRMWEYGQGEVNYERYCLDLCELKHGADAIRCDAYKYIALGP